MSKEKSIVQHLFYFLSDYNRGMYTKLEGKLLTWIDASFTDPEQRKAQKDIVRQLLRDIRDAWRIKPKSEILTALAMLLKDEQYLKLWTDCEHNPEARDYFSVSY